MSSIYEKIIIINCRTNNFFFLFMKTRDVLHRIATTESILNINKLTI